MAEQPASETPPGEESGNRQHAEAEAWIASHTADVTRAQDRLQALLKTKEDALAAGRVEEIGLLVNDEAKVAATLQSLRQQRDLWLAGVPVGPNVHSLGEAAAAIGAAPAVVEAIEAARKQAAAIQQQNWAHWVLAQRSAAHFEEMLTLIARRGETPATYGDETPGGGGILDAAA